MPTANTSKRTGVEEGGSGGGKWKWKEALGEREKCGIHNVEKEIKPRTNTRKRVKVAKEGSGKRKEVEKGRKWKGGQTFRGKEKTE